MNRNKILVVLISITCVILIYGLYLTFFPIPKSTIFNAHVNLEQLPNYLATTILPLPDLEGNLEIGQIYLAPNVASDTKYIIVARISVFSNKDKGVFFDSQYNPHKDNTYYLNIIDKQDIFIKIESGCGNSAPHCYRTDTESLITKYTQEKINLNQPVPTFIIKHF